MQIKTKTNYKRITAFLLALFLVIEVMFSLSPLRASAEGGTQYSNVLDDLSVDSTFDKAKYPLMSYDNFKSVNEDADSSNNVDFIQVIQISESKNGELFVYTYQPLNNVSDITATSINFATTESSILDLAKEKQEATNFKKYSLECVSSEGSFKKYLVKDFTVSNSYYRYYCISEIERPFDRGNQKKKKEHVRVNKKAPKGTSIEQRPLYILERRSFGHWEMDCVCGPTKQSLLVLSERLTRKEIIMPIKTQSAKEVVKALNKIEYKFGKRFKQIFKTITVDNGTEFSDCQGIEKSIYGKGNRTKVYYCHPYSSYERGTNERINREIRRLIPKGTNLATITEKQIRYVEEWVNNYPREIFGFETSNERFAREIAKIA